MVVEKQYACRWQTQVFDDRMEERGCWFGEAQAAGVEISVEQLALAELFRHVRGPVRFLVRRQITSHTPTIRGECVDEMDEEA